MPGPGQVETWTLSLGANGRAKVEHDKATCAQNSLIAGKSKPLGALEPISHESVEGTFTIVGGAVELVLDGNVLHCDPKRVSILGAGASLVVPPHVHAPWRPAKRETIDVLACDRDGLAAPATWTDEPQPPYLPFADPPLEYAHENDDMVIQQGGLRRIDDESTSITR